MLVKYGWHGPLAFARMLNEELRVTLFQNYVASGLKILAESYVVCHGGSLSLPSFVEMTQEKERPQTKEQIIAHVIGIFS